MKKSSLLLAGTTLGGVHAYSPYYHNVYTSTTNAVKIVGTPAYIAGNDGILASAVNLAASVRIWYTFYNPASNLEAAMGWSVANLKLAASTFPETVALSPAEGTVKNLFTSTYSSSYSGTVQFYRGEFSAWSVQQVLSPPSTVDSGKNYFGSTLAFDRDNYDTLFVGCGNCSTPAGRGRGSIYLYKQDYSSGRYTWSQSQVIYEENLTRLGQTKLVVNGDLLMASSTQGPVVFRKVKGEYDAEQIVKAPGGSWSNFDVYDNTIALSLTTAGKNSLTNVGAVYMLASAKPPPLKGKAMPLQWSVQQVLYPSTIAASTYFGNQLSLDGDRLAVTSGGTAKPIYVYERSSATGKWSVQQSITEAGTATTYPFLRGSDLLVIKNASTVKLWDQYRGTADCLTLQVEDDFGDGWDTARLTVTAPGGRKEYFHSRCDIPNPHRVRYCPYETEKAGLYRFEIPDSVKAKNHWEITWRIFDENTGKWYIGSHDTKMDFEWDPEYQNFIPKAMRNVRTNITCQYCTPPPTDKPTPVLRSRALKGNDNKLPVWPNTAQPTPTPAPTVTTTNIGDWRVMTLNAAAQWDYGYYRAYYYVSDAKSQRLITSGTMCPGEANGKKCWVDLPDGEYNVRVGGATILPASTLSWSFCRSVAAGNTKQKQLSIKVVDGECKALSGHASTSFCKGTNGISTPLATVQIEFIVLGVANSDIGTTDRDALVGAIANAFTGLTKSDVSINSASSTSGGLYVSASIAVGEAMGYDVLSIEGIETAISSIQSYMNSNGPKVIWSGLQSAETHTIFSSSTSVEFLSAEVTGSEDRLTDETVVDEVVNYFDQPLETYHDNSQSGASTTLYSLSASGYFLAAGAVAALVVGMFVASRRASKTEATPTAGKDQYSELEASESSSRVQLKDLNLNVPNVAALKQFVESEDEVLKMMLARGK